MYKREFEFIIVDKKENALWITLNRPKASNAFNETMIEELVAILSLADEDSNVHCIIITGSGKNFCAGGDIGKMMNQEGMFHGDSDELRRRYKSGIQQIPLCLNAMSTPVIAMVNGAAIGAGLDLACMCDIRIVSDKARFGESFSRIGLVPGDGGTFFLQRIVGFAKAMEMTLTSKIYDANEAKTMGLVNQVVGDDELKNETKSWVKSICENSHTANSMSKRSMIHSHRASLTESLELLAAYQGIAQRSPEHFTLLKNLIKKS